MKVFEIDYRTGSFNEKISGATPTVNGCVLNKTDKGLSLYSSVGTGKLLYGDFSSKLSFGLGDFSVEWWFRSSNCNGTLEAIFGQGFLAGNMNGFGVFVHTTKQVGFQYRLANGTTAQLNTDRVMTDGLFHHYVVTRVGGVGKMYLDNVLQTTTVNTAIDLVLSNVQFTVFCNTENAWLAKKDKGLAKVVIYNHALTELERTKVYTDFLNSTLLESSKTFDFTSLTPTDLSKEKDSVVGNDLLNPLDFTNVGWNKSVTVTSYTTNSFVTNGVGGIFKTFFTANKKYRITISLVCSGQVTISNGWGTGTPTLKTFSVGTYTDVVIDVLVTNTTLNFWNDAVGTTTIVSCKIQELTGLVAAYNMIPNGNTLVDISGSGKNGTLSNCVSTSDGIKAYKSKLSNISFASPIISASVWSLNLRVKDITNLATSPIVTNNAGLNPSIYLANSIGFRDSSGNLSTFTTPSSVLANPTTLSFVCNGTTIKLYVNGVQDATVVTPANTTLTIQKIFGTGSWFLGITLMDFRLYNNEITIQQVKNYHNQFVRPTLIETFANEGADGIAKVPSGWSKQSGSFKIGEWVPKSGNLIGDSGFDNPAFWTIKEGTWQVLDGKARCTNLQLSNSIGVNNIVSTGKRYRAKFDLTIVSGSLRLNTWGYVGITRTVSGTYVEEFTHVHTTNFMVGFQTTIAGTTGSVDNFTLEEIAPLPTFKNGTKYLECVTAGTISIPSKQAYGVWEFDVSLASSGTQLFIGFINDKVGGITSNTHCIYFAHGATTYLGYYRNTVKFSTASILSANTWYRIRVTRTLAGVSSTYIKGGSFGDLWNLVSTVGGTGTNPVTEANTISSEYLTLSSIQAGDRIANINLYDGIKQ